MLARAPSAPGKTRLVGALSDEQARALREALLLDTLDQVRAAGVPVAVHFTPASAAEEMSALVGSTPLVPQRDGDLGARMAHALSEALAAGAGAVALVGSDLPTLPPEHVTDAFAMLGSGADVVFGPSEDGGFYLIAASEGLGGLFDDVDWERADVLTQVAAAAHAAGLAVGLARPWWDVDVPEDLSRVLGETRDPVAKRVRAWYTLFSA